MGGGNGGGYLPRRYRHHRQPHHGDRREAVGYDVERRQETVDGSTFCGLVKQRPGQALAPDRRVDVKPDDAAELVGRKAGGPEQAFQPQPADES